MTGELMDWEAIYQQQGTFKGPPPWNIGEPQPEITTLIRDNTIRSEVLDAGCGVAELSLELAAQGHTVVGIDISATAIATAQQAAADRALSTATFVQADITSFTGFDGRFNTIIDSTLFHSLPIEARDGYIRSIHRAAAPGATYYVLVFAAHAFPAEMAMPDDVNAEIPKLVTEDELREAVSQYWDVDTIRPAFIHAYLAEALSQIPGVSLEGYEIDTKNRLKMPAYVLTAHKSR